MSGQSKFYSEVAAEAQVDEETTRQVLDAAFKQLSKMNPMRAFAMVSIGVSANTSQEPEPILLPARRESETGTVTRAILLAVLVVLLLLAAAAATSKGDEPRDFGVVGSANFTVMAPRGDHLAAAVLERAEKYRKQIAEEWLGAELPRGEQFTHITVRVNDLNEGLTLLCGPGASLPGDHRMWIDGPRELVTGELLAHEISHVVLNSVCDRRFPIWAHEGIASRYDEADTNAIRSRMVAHWISRNHVPSIRPLLKAKKIERDDQQSYAVAESLVAFLVARGDKKTVLKFAEDGPRLGWDEATRRHYRMSGVSELQQQWAAHLREVPIAKVER